MTTSIQGTAALVGSGEYLPKMLPVDRTLLERMQTKGMTPRVVVVPTAAAPDGATVTERWARMGTEHFQMLGAQVEPVMLLTREDANNMQIASQLAQANFIYFSGGKPRYLLETLRDSEAWNAIRRVYDTGGTIAGCSAGAMVMGSEFFDFPQIWHMRPALALVPGIAIIPHFDELPGLFKDAAIHSTEKVTVVGVEGGTALVGSGNNWEVIGSGGVTVFTDKGRIRFKGGDEVPLQLLSKD
ncbi:MAG TPA: hypothetical protein DHW02_05645 [Ktedonobacter sp.]|nr:hypothetical protein [Ktedonobacter sp.]